MGKTILLSSVALLLCQSGISQTWTPPIGIPDPGFGITDTAPAVPNPWNAPTPGFFYVDNTSVNATDNSNPNGTPAKPRLTIPTDTLPAGSVVEVHGGPYIYNVSCPDAFVAHGTAQSPVYIRGIADAGGNKPAIQTLATVTDGRCFQANGTHYVVEGFQFANGTFLNLLVGGSYAVIRNNEFTGFKPLPDVLGRQYGSVVSAAYHYVNGQYLAGGGDHFVIYNNTFHDNGNYLSTADNKVQGIKFGGQAGVPGTAYVWILNNTFYHNGQAMQHGDDCVGTMVNGLCQPDTSWFPNHFYIGKNVIHDDREVGIALKMVRDFVISQNDVYNYLDLPPGTDCSTSPIPTALNIGRFASDRVWILFNKVHNSVIGIRSNGQDEGYTGPTPVFPSVYIIGNVISNTHAGTNCTSYNASDPYSGGAAVIGWNNYRDYVVDNTIANSDKGISFTSVGYYEVTGNLILNTGDPMNFVPTSWGTNKYDYNFYDSIARLAYGSATPIITLSQMQASGQEANSKQGWALTDTTYKPASGSPSIDASIRSSVYDKFFSLYGIDIAKDIEGTPRPMGSAWDMGAYEYNPALTTINNNLASNAANHILIYPNPNNGIFQILAGNEQQTPGKIEIYNALGECIYHSANPLIHQSTSIDLSNQPKGIYFVQVIMEDRIMSKKIIRN